MNKAIHYVRSTKTVRPCESEIKNALAEANRKLKTESARMQFPKVNNW